MTVDPLLLGGALGTDQTPLPQIALNPEFANRHGLIAGATGTGKTVTLQVLAEGFSRIGVPVFMADVKGDLSGIAVAGSEHPKVSERVDAMAIDDFAFSANPVVFWDLYGEQGHSVRATISEMGPALLSRLLQLNDTQEGILSIVFEYADDEGLLLLNLDDLETTLRFVADNAKSLRSQYGNISAASVGAIQRRLLGLKQDGAEQFFGEPGLALSDLIRVAPDGRGYVNVLAADKLMRAPRLYATFLLWLLSELFEELPEVGDAERPKLVFFFDEAHLLFSDAPKALIEKVETVVRLIRSKGVGVYFITQNPLDLPEAVLGQLGNRVQHALRAFTPKDQKAVRACAQTMRANPRFKTEEAITQLGVGEALVSVLEDDGIPSVTERTFMAPPRSRIGPIDPATRSDLMRRSPHGNRYDETLDRESAHERLLVRAQHMATEAEAAKQAELQAREEKRASRRQGMGEAIVKSLARSLASSVGRSIGKQILRGLLGSIMRGGK